MTDASGPSQLLDRLELTEYEKQALEDLVRLGRTTAPNLSEATGIPKARIYDVLDSLSDVGYIKVIPGRPKEYEPKSPADILDRATENRRQEYETYKQSIDNIRGDFIETFGHLYERATDELSPTEELFYVVNVGEPSIQETRSMYTEAIEQVCVISKSFEYFESVEPSIKNALDQGIDINILLLHPRHLSAKNQTVQKEMSDHISSSYPEIKIRFSTEPLPWRGTIVDPSMDYDSGQAVLLVEEKDIPLHNRQAAVTENESFVAGMKRYFDLVWNYESVSEYPRQS